MKCCWTTTSITLLQGSIYYTSGNCWYKNPHPKIIEYIFHFEGGDIPTSI